MNEVLTPPVLSVLPHLSDYILVRQFFRKLWQGYSAGGINMGRSLQARLLETYLSFNPYSDNAYEGVGLRDFANEADRRHPVLHRPQVFGTLKSLSVVSSGDISLLCIEALRVWYRLHENERCSQGWVANTWEGRFVTSICRIMPIPVFPYFYTDADMFILANEADDRIRIDFEVDADHPFYD